MVRVAPRRDGNTVAKNITISEVAERSGVSISTVSRVLNRLHSGDPDVRERVLKAARELEYKPSEAARVLAGGGRRIGTLSLSYVMHSFIPFGTYYGDILRGAEEQAQRHENNLYFATAYHQLAALGAGSTPKGTSGEDIQGLISAGEIPMDFYEEVKKAGIPLVHINTYPEGEAADCIMCDNFAASYRVVRWLVELGHRRIACIGHGAATGYRVISTHERAMGYRQALFDAGVPFDPALVVVAEACLASHGQAAMERLLEVSPPPTAVFGVVDEVAVGAIQCARAKGLRVPQDLSVVGVNDLDIAEMCEPPLTTVRIFREEMGRVAVARLMELINNPGQRPTRIDVLCELVKRDSCGPAP